MTGNKMGHLDMLERTEVIDFILNIAICYILNKGHHSRLSLFTKTFHERAETPYGKLLAKATHLEARDWYNYINNLSEAHIGMGAVRHRGKLDK